MEWLSKPLIIVRRSSALEAQLIAADEVLYRDPLSQASVQPESALNAQRSHTDNWFVALGLGTGMGCALTYKPAAAEIFQGKPWSGGFVDGCDAAHYDLAGRVYADQKARLNLTVPVWELVDQQLVLKPQ